MRKKNNLFKNIFYIFFAFCFLSAGIFTLGINENDAFAEGEDLPSYFSAKEYIKNGDNDILIEDGLISSDIFLYSPNSKLKLSFAYGSALEEQYSSIYDYVYYPDETDTTKFFFYNFTGINLSINGQKVEGIESDDIITNYDIAFINRPENKPQTFEMVFAGNSDNHQISLVKDSKVVEGLYTITIDYTLFECRNGKNDASEDYSDFYSDNKTLTYSFYVVERDNYLTNGIPNSTYNKFDNFITSPSATYDYYAFANYSAKENENEISYIEYDYNRYEVEVSKNLSTANYTQAFTYDTENAESPVASSGDEIVYQVLDTENHTAKIYFYDLGNYVVSYTDILLLNFTEDNQTTLQKHYLDGLTNIMRDSLVYVYGFQANYTDMDGIVDENGNRPLSELRTNNFEQGKYEQSADITSSFLNSNESYTQNSSTFVIKNIVDYINDNNITPVVTNQTPIKFISNATLTNSSNSSANTTNSYIFSNKNLSSNYSETSFKLDGETLYSTKFNGQAEGAVGRYIYLVSYTFNNYYETSSTRASDKVFYQVFYFEISKQLPTIRVETVANDGEQAQTVYSGSYTNKNITITDTTTDNPYNRDVEIRVYASNFDGNYLNQFGGTNGINFYDLPNSDGIITLSANAHYTIRLYNKSEVTSSNINISSKKGFFREQKFTIDKTDVENISATNVTEIVNSTNYNVYTPLTTISTNQNIVLSWDEKASGAKTTAYYKYFKLQNFNYYSYYNDPEDETTGAIENSSAINKMLNTQAGNNSYLPIDYTLNMSSADNYWFEYKGNSQSQINEGVVSSEYVLSDEGLYLVDVYDEAGNHSLEIYIIDYTKPYIALYDDVTGLYSIATGSAYISNTTSMLWSKYKSIYVSNFSSLYNSYTKDSITEELISSDTLFKNHNGKASIDIFNIFYDKLIAETYFRTLQNNTIAGEGSSIYGKPYTGTYLAIPISPVYYYLNSNDEYEKRQNSYSETITADQEMNYRVLIRDESNKQYFQPNRADFSEDELIHYTQYYSATQKLTVSFDLSSFVISYTYNEDGKEKTEDMSSNVVYVDETADAKTTYLSPTKMSKAFKMAFTPTQIEGDSIIQVDKIIIKYYKFEKYSPAGENYTYYAIANSSTETIVYEYNGESQTERQEETIRLNLDGITSEGKYEITRTYRKGDEFTYNENDYFSRTFVLIVDRNEVISNPDLVKKDNNEGSHLESLVGGDVFVAVYDNQISADLVVTFPDSTEGNSKGSSLYNNGTARTVFTTNMLPVNVYIPKYKYTTYASKVEDGSGYYFEVENNDNMNKYFNAQTEEDATKYATINKYIPEYALYAEIYKDSKSNMIASSKLDKNAPYTNGFLNLYNTDGSRLVDGFKEAGTYWVVLYQGMFLTDVNKENSYTQFIEFTFDIKASTPDFIVTSSDSAELNSIVDNSIQTYYTNNSSVKLSWNAGSEYIAEIDQENIVVKVNGNSRAYYAHQLPSTVWTTPTLSNNVYTTTLNLKQLGLYLNQTIYENDCYVEITMQYKNHDDSLYKKVTKRILVDLSAPSDNIIELVNNSISSNMIYGLKLSSLRTYNTANMEVTTNLANTSYNISNSTGNFAYYSYMVTQDYLQKLISTKDYLTYVRIFEDSLGNCTKYNTEVEQETSPATFLPSNFTEVANLTRFKTNSYYEIVELDRAGNMSIYTIYVTNYNTQENENDNLISYTKVDGEEGNYTIEDYNLTKTYSGALNNIYNQLGMKLENINYFGDAWAQMKLKITSASGISTIYYLMLTPWDSTHAYSFSNGNVTTYEISSLIDGSINSRYKNVLSIYNRENLQTDNFYFNTRSTDLVANMTETQDDEYIKFDIPQDSSINSEIYASTYLTKLSIKANDVLLYEQENALGFASLWTGNDNVIVTHNETARTITFAINKALNFQANTKILYEYTNNYGKEYKEVHLYKETIIKNEVSSENDLYAYYSSTGVYYYITKNGFQYYYNPNKYAVKTYTYSDWQENADEIEYPEEGQSTVEEIENYSEITSNGIKIRTISSNTYDPTITAYNPYNETYVIEVYDISSGNWVKRIFFTLYDELPSKNFESSSNTEGQFKLLDASRNNITERITERLSSDETGYFSEVTLMYSQANTFIPVKYYFSEDKQNWTEVASGTRFTNSSDKLSTYYIKVWYDTEYLKNEYGASAYVFENVPSTQIYEFNLSSLTSTFWVEKTVGSTTSIIERSNTIFKTTDGRQYSNHYIVNLNYRTERSSVQIKTNKEQNISATMIGDPIENGNVVSELWKISNEDAQTANLTSFSTYIVISFIPTSSNFVAEFYSYNSSGVIDTSDNLISKTSKQFVLSKDSTSLSRGIKLQWTKYNGIVQNEIKLSVVKDGVSMTPTIYSENAYNYCYLPYSGKYLLSLYDMSGNVQKFNYGSSGQSDTFTYIFLKDVPFTVTHTDIVTGEEITSLPIKQAIYNGSVTLSIDNASRSDFYQVGGFPVLTVTRNGVELTQDDYETISEGQKTQYIFTAAGSYEVYFTATSKLEGIGQIKEEKYQFIILNANENKYSHILNKYSNYYIEKIEKNGIDITNQLVSTLNVSKVVVSNKTYLNELSLSYLDEKTGSGKYLITVNSNAKDLTSTTLPSYWTYQVVIKSGIAPISISVEEGKNTDAEVTVTYNKTNIYQEMGECQVRIIQYGKDGKYYGVVYSDEINSETLGQQTATIKRDSSGTFYVQIVSSDNLLFSYKVAKDEPMNPASIIAIVSSVVLGIVIIIIVVKLRKRISVK